MPFSCLVTFRVPDLNQPTLRTELTPWGRLSFAAYLVDKLLTHPTGSFMGQLGKNGAESGRTGDLSGAIMGLCSG